RERARESIGRAVQLDPNDPTGLYLLAAVLMMDKVEGQDYDIARDALRRALDQHPDDLDARTLLGQLQERSRHYPQAAELYRQVVLQDPTRHAAAYRLGQTWLHLGRKAEGEKLLALHPQLRQAVLRARHPAGREAPGGTPAPAS